MENRKVAPPIKSGFNFQWNTPEKRILNEHANLFWIKNSKSNTCKIEFSFHLQQSKKNKLIKSLSYNLLLSGNESISSDKIKNEFDHLGAYTDIQVFTEHAEISIYVLKENLMKSVELLFTYIGNVNYPVKDYEILLKKRKSNFLIEAKKSSTISRREFNKQLFHNTYLGKSLELYDFESIELQDLKDYYNSSISNHLNKVCIVGNLENNQIDKIQKIIESWTIQSSQNFLKCNENKVGEKFIPIEQNVQTSIRLGKFCVRKTDEDYFGFCILNTILGDYFGSRLMKNIREDKGYTYGIGSFIQHLKKTSYLGISTQVAKEYRQKTLEEIQNEFQILQNSLVGSDELNTVRNYLLGQMMKAADGVYAQMNLFVGVDNFGLDMSFYDKYLQTIESISSEKIQELAQKHLNWNDFTIVSAG